MRKDDPRVTDLSRYRRARERARRAPPPKPKTRREPVLGARPRAGLSLAAVIFVVLAFSMGGLFH